MATKMATACRFALVDTLASSFIYHPISSKFNIGITFIKLSPKLEYWFCLMKDNQFGRQNVCCLQVWFYGHSNLVIYHLISSKFHIRITFIKLFPKINCQFALVDTLTDKSKFHIWNTFFNLLPMIDEFCLIDDKCKSDCRSRGLEFDPGPVPYFHGDR